MVGVEPTGTVSATCAKSLSKRLVFVGLLLPCGAMSVWHAGFTPKK